MKTIDLNNIKHIHMVGIGGIGMSGLAHILRASGKMISGSDLKDNRLIRALIRKGCNVAIGHKRLYGQPQLVVRSFAVKDNNPEILDAKKRCIPLIGRSELLNAYMGLKNNSVSIAGTHGKTTTTAMISYIFDRAGLKPTVLIGGEQKYFKGNAKIGKSDILVTETDESDGCLARMSPRYLVVTNLEKEHMEYYKTMRNLLGAFRSLISNIPRDGMLFYNNEDHYLRKLSGRCKGKKIGFGMTGKSDFYCALIVESGLSVEFDLFFKGKRLGNIMLNIPGRHNVYNALACIAVCMKFGISFGKIKQYISGFSGVKRRFEIRSRAKGILLVEDYAHHPTEIRAVIQMAGTLGRKRIIAVFQPHRFTRTMHLKKEFGQAFTGTDELILTDIYAAHERPIEGVGIDNIFKCARRNGIKRAEIVSKQYIPKKISSIARDGDIVLILGAGNINETIPDIIRLIKMRP